jgi:hypothetical protein
VPSSPASITPEIQDDPVRLRSGILSGADEVEKVVVGRSGLEPSAVDRVRRLDRAPIKALADMVHAGADTDAIRAEYMRLSEHQKKWITGEHKAFNT